MKPFNNMLEVGMKAIIIGTRLPENSWLIGKVVTVECFLSSGEEIPQRYTTSDMKTGQLAEIFVVVSGEIGRLTTRWREGFRMFNPKNLMPLPPLDELEQQKEKELNLCH